jgi:hypothetical protein
MCFVLLPPLLLAAAEKLKHPKRWSVFSHGK